MSGKAHELFVAEVWAQQQSGKHPSPNVNINPKAPGEVHNEDFRLSVASTSQSVIASNSYPLMDATTVRMPDEAVLERVPKPSKALSACATPTLLAI